MFMINQKMKNKWMPLSTLMGSVFLFLLSAAPLSANTTTVFGNYTNPLLIPPGTQPWGDQGTSATFFNSYDGQMRQADGQYVVPKSSDGSLVLSQSSFGQMVSKTVPYKNFEQLIIEEVCIGLYYDYEAQCKVNTLAVDNGRENAPFKYKVFLYGELDDGGTQKLTAQFETIKNHWSEDKRTEALKYAQKIIDALAYSPTHEGLQNVLLDIYYEIAVADFTLANETYVDVIKARLGLGYTPAPGELSITEEIKLLEQAIPLFESAMKPYYQLLTEPMGIDTDKYFNNVNEPYGYSIFKTMVPTRSFAALSFQRTDANGNKTIETMPTDGDSVYSSGFKDLDYIYQVQRQLTRVTADLVRLYVMRQLPAEGNELSDIQKANNLFSSTIQKVYTDGQIINGIYTQAQLENVHTGLKEAKSGWKQAVAELNNLKPFIEGKANPLGLSSDFLGLVDKNVIEQYAAGSGPKDSFAYFKGFLSSANSPLIAASTAYTKARDSYGTLRTFQDQIKGELTNQRRTYVDRIRSIVGIPSNCSADSVAHCQIPDDPTFLNDQSVGYDPTHPYHSPESNKGGEIYQQRLNIDLAVLRIKKNKTQIDNLQKEIEIEVDRRGKENGINNTISGVYIHYGNKQASLTKEIGKINAIQAAANAAAAATSSWSSSPATGWIGSIGHGINGIIQVNSEIDKARLSAEKEKLAAKQSSTINSLNDQILDANSKARVKTLLLSMSTLAIDSLEASIGLKQEFSRLQALYEEKEHIESEWLRSQESLATRYFADPTHRMMVNRDLLEANFAFNRAQFWVFAMARSLDYKWNTHVMETGNLIDYSASTVFRLRNAPELEAMVVALNTFDGKQNIGTRGDGDFVTVSLREDIWNYNRAEGGKKYIDPDTGNQVDALAAFRGLLKSSVVSTVKPHLQLIASEVIELRFSTLKPITNFFEAGHWNEKIDELAVQVITSQASEAVNVWLEQSGVSYIRNPNFGTRDSDNPDVCQGEWTTYPTGFWKTDAQSGLKYEESFGQSFGLHVSNPADPRPPLDKFRDVFHELSPVVSEWVLQIPYTDRDGENIFDIDKISDVQVHFINFWNTRTDSNTENLCSSI